MLKCLWILGLAGIWVRAVVIRDNREDSDFVVVISQELVEKYNARLFESETSVLFTKLKKTYDRHKRDVRNISTIELAIFTDSALFQNMKKRYQDEAPDNTTEVITDLVLALISSVQLYLSQKTLDLEIQIEIVHMHIDNDTNTSGDLTSDGDIKKYLDMFCKYQRNTTKGANLSWDHAVLLTGLDLYTVPDHDTGKSGISYQSGMCSEQSSCTISEFSSLGSASLIIAHELSHNMGVTHDGEGANIECYPHSFIMGPKLSHGAIHWSDCSRKQMKQFIFQYGECLGNKPASKYYLWNYPGHRFDGSAQCLLLYGPGWTIFNGQVKGKLVTTCAAIWCRRAEQIRSPGVPPLQGTPCEHDGHCWDGQCVARGNEQ